MLKYGWMSLLWLGTALTLVGTAGANPPCGTTLGSGLHELDGPLTCPSTALKFNTGATLDCKHHAITGPDIPPADCTTSTTPGCTTDRYGLRIEAGKSNVTIQNCIVTQFERGLYATGTSNLQVRDSVFHGNTRYGVAVVQGTTGHLQRSTWQNNRDEGIHVSASPVQITDSDAVGNVSEGFYILNTTGVILTRPAAVDNGAAGVYVKDSPQTEIRSPVLTNNGLQVVRTEGGSTVNQTRVFQPTTRTPRMDFNGDGQTDILLRHDSGAFYIWIMESDQVVGQGSPGGAAPSEWFYRGTGDFNGDGKSDILLQHISGVFAIWLMDGATKIGEGFPPGGPPSEWTFVGLGDFDGDGKTDIVLQHISSLVYINFMNGVNIRTSAAVSGTGSEWEVQP